MVQVKQAIYPAGAFGTRNWFGSRSLEGGGLLSPWINHHMPFAAFGVPGKVFIPVGDLRHGRITSCAKSTVRGHPRRPAVQRRPIPPPRRVSADAPRAAHRGTSG